MPELLRIKTEDYIFTVKAASIASRQEALAQTLRNRHRNFEKYSVKFMPPVTLVERPKVYADGQASLSLNQNQLVSNDEINIIEPLFFENTLYQFELIFLKNIETAQLTHRSQNICEAFIFSPSEEGVNARLTGSINTGNNVGWMRLPLSYQYSGSIKEINQHIAFEVLPTKMALHQDLPVMYQAIDRTFPLWRFSLVEKTEQDASKGNTRGNFPLMWLANFSQLRARFEQGLKVICQAPHSRLQPQVTQVKAAKLKGRVSYKLGERVKQDFTNGQFEKHYRIEKKKLSVDTFENRFIKMAVTNTKQQLSNLEQRLRVSNKVPDKQKLSDAFLDELHHWQSPLQKVLDQSFMKEIGKHTGQNRESLVLQQKTGYSAVYRVWQELKFYLDVFGDQSSLSIKSVADIYEIWCFLCIKKILEQLGFEQTSKKVELTENEFLEYKFKDGLTGAFHFERSDGVKARLAHEPKFGKKSNPIRTYMVNQVPDIVLEVTLPATDIGTSTRKKSAKQFIWLFDAKYRIKNDKNRFDKTNTDVIDHVPDDAINQMHRYRDALIHLSEENIKSKKSDVTHESKSRPVFGAFALYPGYFDQEKDDNPYQDAINEIGIGAFALLPFELKSEPSIFDKQSSDTVNSKKGNAWLFNFLAAQIGIKTDDNSGQSFTYNKDNMAEKLYVQEAARIPYHGMKQVLYPDLTMTIALGPQKGRDAVYFNGFEHGTAQWYHTKQAPIDTLHANIGMHVVEEIRYLALASTSKVDTGDKEITKLWPVKHVMLVPRNSITEQQSGASSNSSDLYYLFELGRPLTLQNPITKVPMRSFSQSIKLTTLSKLENVQVFNDVEQVYKK
jgi:hypothetical protein